MPRPVDLLLEFLHSELERGVTHVHLDEGAREGLRGLFEKSRAARRAPAPPADTTVVEPVRARPATAPAQIFPGADPETPPPPPAPSPTLQSAGSPRTERLDALRRQAEKWPAALALGSLRPTMVFATGNPDARLMLVGEAPGFHEEKEREPFVGPAGQKLNDILRAMGIARPEVYISNIVKFRPSTANQTTNNRKPSIEEMAACMPFIRAEIEIVRPECIVALGGTAAEGLLGLAGTVGGMRGRWHAFEGIPVRVTYHPSYLLQSGATGNAKRLLWEDMLAVMEKLAMPISEKQRGYFLPKG